MRGRDINSIVYTCTIQRSQMHAITVKILVVWLPEWLVPGGGGEGTREGGTEIGKEKKGISITLSGAGSSDHLHALYVRWNTYTIPEG